MLYDMFIKLGNHHIVINLDAKFLNLVSHWWAINIT